MPLSVVHTCGSTSNVPDEVNPLVVPVAVITCSPFCTPAMSTRTEKLPSAPAVTVEMVTPSRPRSIVSPGLNPDPEAVTKAPTQGPGSKTASSSRSGGRRLRGGRLRRWSFRVVSDVVSVSGVVSDVVSVSGVVSDVVSVSGVVSDVVSVSGVVSEVVSVSGVVSEVVSVSGVVSDVVSVSGVVSDVVSVSGVVVSHVEVVGAHVGDGGGDEPYGSGVDAPAMAIVGVIRAAAITAITAPADSVSRRVLPGRRLTAAGRFFTVLHSMT